MNKKVYLSCEVCASRNYTTHKSNTPNKRLNVRKYCKKCNEHTVHKETK